MDKNYELQDWQTIEKIAQFYFKNLQKTPIFCTAIGKDVKIPHGLWHHITKKYGNNKIKRLMILPLLPEILKNGKIIDKKDSDFVIQFRAGKLQFFTILSNVKTHFLVKTCFAK